MYEILAYLFENCRKSDLSQNSEGVARQLSAAGFEDSDINQALTWLAGVVRGPHRMVAPLPDAQRALRAYAPKELAKLDAVCRGFLLYLEQQRVLTPQTREHVIERALAASGDALTLKQLKLIVLMVLWNEQTPAGRLLAEELSTAGGPHLPS
jgi:Smg protein